MSSPQKIAKVLIERFGNCLWSDDESQLSAKKCATLFCDILLTHEDIPKLPRKERERWQNVKDEIKNFKP